MTESIGRIIQDLKARVRLSEFVSRRVALKRMGTDYFGICPFPGHKEKTGSFSVNDEKQFYHCFGCNEHGDVLDWLQKIEGLTIAEAMDRLRHAAGENNQCEHGAERDRDEDAAAAKRQAAAFAIFGACGPVQRTLGETYLREARRISVDLPDSLRFHPGLPPEPREPQTFPTLVAAVTDLRGCLVAIQRTFLKHDGSDKAPIPRPKLALGPIRHGSVHLDNPPPGGSVLGIAEGIETALSAVELFRIPVWAALGSNLAGVLLPATISHVAIFADRGSAGETAAKKARAEFRAQRRRVSVRFPASGKDFNDELKARNR
jgi:DNA primase